MGRKRYELLHSTNKPQTIIKKKAGDLQKPIKY